MKLPALNINWIPDYMIHSPKIVISSLLSMASVNKKEFEVKCKNNISVAYMLNITSWERLSDVAFIVADSVSLFEEYFDLAE